MAAAAAEAEAEFGRFGVAPPKKQNFRKHEQHFLGPYTFLDFKILSYFKKDSAIGFLPCIIGPLLAVSLLSEFCCFVAISA